MTGDSATPNDPETTPDPEVAPSPADAPPTLPEPVIPPPPAEIPIPDDLIPPPSSAAAIADATVSPPPVDIPPADAVIPPPPPEAMISTRRSNRPAPFANTDDAPAAASEDWAQPTMTPEVPSSGGYRALTAAIFAFLFILFAGALALVIYLATSTRLDFSTLGQEASISAPSAVSADEIGDTIAALDLTR